MKKVYLLTILLIFLSVTTISCSDVDTNCLNSMGYNNCTTYESCKADEDCNEGFYCNQTSYECRENPCTHAQGIDCGVGQCVVDGYGSTSCECDEGYAQQDGSRCLLKCNSYTDCIGFQVNERDYSVCSDSVNGGVCNLAVCSGEDSCPIGTCQNTVCLE